ncbi:type III PLP-dependent enzyme [Rhizohabitans arisaemae]|uniref:type III PLP-dependent enzyme n=1 Tax=Rhizohabitans arisaemae TaxID=2720610 RepID=UPI0024B1D202|nr:type III PLP-dependent enzyme [Rhizohabitans arisaemae]
MKPFSRELRSISRLLASPHPAPISLPAYVYDLYGLAGHAAAIRAALPGVELFYAAKANPDPALLRVLADHVDGFEVASGGELAHVHEAVPGARLAFGGPGKTDGELALALRLGVERIHVESVHELRRLAELARNGPGDRPVNVLLRANLTVPIPGAVLAMGGGATPFGMDPVDLEVCAGLLREAPGLRLRGIHAHLASGLDADALLSVARSVLDWARPWCAAHGVPEPEINLGGGMAVDYTHDHDEPGRRFDWTAYGQGLAASRLPGETLRVEPGRAVTAYCGWYLARVLDVKRVHGELFAIVSGGTHHLRTPAAKGHSQPFVVFPGAEPHPGAPAAHGSTVTVAGQLCTPKDVLARDVPVDRLAVGDVVAFAMAGAYAWNISHHDFLMHPKPSVHYMTEESWL